MSARRVLTVLLFTAFLICGLYLVCFLPVLLEITR